MQALKTMVNHQKGLVVVLIFYVVIAGVGIWASMKHKTGEERFKKVKFMIFMKLMILASYHEFGT